MMVVVFWNFEFSCEALELLSGWFLVQLELRSKLAKRLSERTVGRKKSMKLRKEERCGLLCSWESGVAFGIQQRHKLRSY